MSFSAPRSTRISISRSAPQLGRRPGRERPARDVDDQRLVPRTVPAVVIKFVFAVVAAPHATPFIVIAVPETAIVTVSFAA